MFSLSGCPRENGAIIVERGIVISGQSDEFIFEMTFLKTIELDRRVINSFRSSLSAFGLVQNFY